MSFFSLEIEKIKKIEKAQRVAQEEKEKESIVG